MKILFHDRDLIAAVKPAGMDSEQEFPSELQKTLGGEIYPVHRLDLNVGGVMIFARNRQTAAALSRSVQEGTVVKEYVTLVHGMLPPSGHWEDLLFKDSRRNKAYAVKRERKGVKKAILEFRAKSGQDVSFAHVRLYTGRSHQIRVQFSSRGFPLVGDHKYGSRAQEMQPMLYSCRVTFPWKGSKMTFCNLPEWAVPYVGEALAPFDSAS